MTAHFQLEDLHRLRIVLTPENGADRLLLAVFIRFDANIFTASVNRRDDKQIESLTLSAGNEI